MPRFHHEPLESRRLLTAYIVDSLLDGPAADDGQTTLREAITAANTNAGADSITFSADIAGGTISLGDELSITDDLSIDGQGGYTTLDAGGDSRVFNVSGAGSFSVADLILTNGSADVGGAIYLADGSTTLDAVLVTGSSATGSAGGGGIYLAGGDLTINSSKVTGNTATNDAGNSSGGGLFAADGTVTIVNSLFANNTAQRAGGAIESGTADLSITDSALEDNDAVGAPGNGGALHVTGSGVTVDFTNSSATGNFAAAEGGGLWNNAGSTMTVTNSLVTGNDAAGDDADNGGGGLYNNGGTFNVVDSEVSNNTASGSSGSGGAFLSTAGDVTVTNSGLNGNAASRAGGAIELVDGDIAIDNSLLDGNSTGAAPGNGGAFHVTGMASTIDIANSQVSNNVAAAEGGGVWNQAGSTMNIVNTEISGNSANGDAADNGGGGVFNNGGDVNITNSLIDGNNALGTAGSGGGLLSLDGAVAVQDSQISNNLANRAGGGVEIVDGDFDFDNSELSGNGAGADAVQVYVTGITALNDSGVDGTVTVTRVGTQLTVNVEATGLVPNQTHIQHLHGTFEDPAAAVRIPTDAKTPTLADDADGDGYIEVLEGVPQYGPIILSLTTPPFNDNAPDSDTFSFPTAPDGTISFTETYDLADESQFFGTLTMIDFTGQDLLPLEFREYVVHGTTVPDGAGAGTTGEVDGTGGYKVLLPAGSGELELQGAVDGLVAAPGNGGGLHVSGVATVDFTGGSLVANNVAASEGGGLWNQAGSTLTVDNSVVTGNIAFGDAADNGGGGIFNNGGTLAVSNSEVNANLAIGASGSGGGIFSTAGLVTVDASEINGNTANRAGGGVEIIDGTAEFTGADLLGNTAGPNGNAAPGNGGALHVTGVADVAFDNSYVAFNNATQGGGLWNQTGSLLSLLDTVVEDNTATNEGGGIYNKDEAVLAGSFVTNNTAGTGGGIFTISGATTTLVDTVVDGNEPDDLGGPGTYA